jgi:translation initiation factor IF-2
MGISEYATAEERHAIFHGVSAPEPAPVVELPVPEPAPVVELPVPEPEPVVEAPAPEPEVEDEEEEEDVPVSRSAALIEEALNAKK